MRELSAMSRCPQVAFLAAVLVLAALADASAQTKQTYAIARAGSAVNVDGVLDEPAWQTATTIPLKYEWFPGENVAPQAATECLVTYDDEHLYVAFRAADPEPDRIRARLADRDTPFQDDTVGFMIDPFNDERRAFQFRINALGVQMDATNNDIDGNEDWSWDAIWESRGRITDTGYVVEVALPFAQLRFPRQDPQTWGFLAMRDWPRSLRHRMRSALTDRNRTCLVCQFEKLSGFTGIEPGRSIELDPTVTAARTDARPAPGAPMEEGDFKPQAGISGRWSVTPNVILNATVNPDFYQVEADAAQLDVNTRFALYYPEKRPFFLEGADFFATPFEAVFTRTVADPSWGAKLTGKEGGNAFGAFVTRDEINNLVFPSNQGSRQETLEQNVVGGVFRYRRDVAAGSTIGLLYTARDGDSYSNHVIGGDGLLRFTRSDTLHFQFLASATEYPDDLAARQAQPVGQFAGSAALVSYRHGTRNWSAFAEGSLRSPQFRADSGFITRVDTRQLSVGVARFWYGRPGQWFSRLEVDASADVTYDFDGRLTDRGLDFPIFYQGPWQSQAMYNPSPNLEYYRGVRYENFRHNFNVLVRPSGSVVLGVSGQVGGAIDYANARQADTFRLDPSIDVNLGRHVSMGLAHAYQKLDVQGGQLFTANLTQLRAMFHLNLRSYVRAIVQYTDIVREAELYTSPVPGSTRRLFAQYLFSYKVNPQTVLLAGYSDGYDGERRVDLTQTNRTVFLKAGYALLW